MKSKIIIGVLIVLIVVLSVSLSIYIRKNRPTYIVNENGASLKQYDFSDISISHYLISEIDKTMFFTFDETGKIISTRVKDVFSELSTLEEQLTILKSASFGGNITQDGLTLYYNTPIYAAEDYTKEQIAKMFHYATIESF